MSVRLNAPASLSCFPRRGARHVLLTLLSFVLLAGPSPGQEERESSSLEEDRLVRGELSAGQSHTYRVELAAGHFMHLTVEQHGVDIAVGVFDAGGRKLLDINNSFYYYGRETVSLIPETAGSYRLEVRTAHQMTAGRYALRLAPLRAATAEDRLRISAEEGLAGGEKAAREAKSPEPQREAAGRLEANASLWRRLGDKYGEATALSAIAGVRRAQGQSGQAVQLLNQALTLYRALGDQGHKALTLYVLGVLHTERKENAQALSLLGQALTLWRAFGERQTEAYTLNYLGLAHLNKGELPKALDQQTQALQLMRQLNNRAGEAQTLHYIGVVYRAQGETGKAVESFNKALAYYRSVYDYAAQAATLYHIAATYDWADEDQEAIEPYTKAAELYHVLKDRRNEAAALHDLGTTYDELGQKQKALEVLDSALTLRRGLGEPAKTAATLYHIGTVYDDLNEEEKALGFFDEALALYRAAADRHGEARTINYMADVHLFLGRHEEALKHYNTALAIRREIKDGAGEAETLNDLGLIYLGTNQSQRALDGFTRARDLARASGRRQAEIQALNGLGLTYSSLGQYTRALRFHNQALALSREAHLKEGEAQALTFISNIHSLTGETAAAHEAQDRASTLISGLGDVSAEAFAAFNRGIYYLARDENQKAIDEFNRATAAARGGKPEGIFSIVQVLIGIGHAGLNDEQKAYESFTSALPHLRAVGNRNFEAVALAGIASIERERGNLTAAKTHTEAALKIVETLRTAVASQELRLSFFASAQDYYELYIDILMDLHKREPSAGHDVEAFRASEQGRARSLLDTLNESKADIRRGVDPALVKREQALRQRLNAAAQQQQVRRLSGAGAGEQAQADGEDIESLTVELQQVEAEIRQKSPAYAALTQPQPLTLAQVQTQVLDPDTLLLEYSLGDDRSFLWAVTQSGITSYELPRRRVIDAAARKVYELLNARTQQVGGESAAQRRQRIARADTEYPAAAARLSQLVLAPAAQQLGDKRLLVVAHGTLQYIPFGALPDPNGGPPPAPLILRREVVSALSASTLALLRRETKDRAPAPKGVAVLADPVFARNDERLRRRSQPAPKTTPARRTRTLRDLKHERPAVKDAPAAALEFAPRISRLPYTRREAEEILKLAAEEGSATALDFAANRQFITNPELGRYRYVHLATHGFIDSDHPDLSGVVLSMFDEKGAPQDGFLRAHEIFNLKLPAELVVLSACQTGLGQEVRGEGLVGLTRGFMYAGAPRVVVSLWSVSDRATAELMARFYRGVLQEKLRPAAALRAAQVSLMKEPGWESPFYWAAFTLQGEWR